MNLTFAGYPIELRKIQNDVLIHCKNVIGTYSQAKSWIDKDKGNYCTYYFGIKQSDKCEILNSINNTIKIACLEGTEQELKQIITQCSILLNT